MPIIKRAYLKNEFSVLSWNFQKILTAEDELTKRQYVHATTNATTAATFTTTTSTKNNKTTPMIHHVRKYK